MKERTILGHIDCPYCGHVNGMRVTPDKNGAPFGYCEARCAGQLRVGGDASRVDAFYAKNPHVQRTGQAAPAAPAPAPAAAAAPKAAKAPPAPPAPPPPPERKPMSGVDWLLSGGVRP